METSSLGCSTIWHQTSWDWSNCLRIKIFNSFLPLFAILLSISILILRFVFSISSKKKKRIALKVAKLDPEASTFQLGNGNGHQNGHGNGTSSSDSTSTSNPFLKLIHKLLPWNSTRFVSSSPNSAFQIPSNPATSSLSNVSTSNDSSNHKKNQASSARASFASKAVRQAENAVILHEVISTPLQRQTSEEKSKLKSLELLKRFSETLLSIALASVYVADWISTQDQRDRSWKLNWVLLWSYLSLLSAYTLTTSHSFFKHKALILFLSFVISVSNLRSAYLSSRPSNKTLTLVELILTFLNLIPTLFFPLQMRLPARLRAIHSTMRAEKRHGLARTALPTPNVNRSLSPSESVLGEEEDELLVDEDGNRQQNQADEEADEEATANEGGIDVEEIRAALLRDSKTETSEDEKVKIPSPEVFASLFDRATFGFVTPAMWKHYKIPFRPETVPELPAGDKAAAVVASYRAAFESSNEKTSSGLKKSSRPLHVRLFLHFLPFLILQFFWALLQACMVLTPAIGMRYILAYIAQRDRRKRGELGEGEVITPTHMAVLYAFVMLAGQMLSSVSASQALFIGRRICIQLRAILITEIVTKTLRRRENSGGKSKESEGDSELSEEDKKKKEKENERATDGQVTNLLSVDVFKVSEICAYLHFICPQSPVQIGLCLYLLFNLLGWAAFVGFIILLISIPFQTITASLFVKLQRQLLEATDERLNLVTEVLGSIKTVKFFAWEKSFEARMDQTRMKELRVLRNRFGAYLLNAITFVGTPMLVTVVTFTVHTKVLKRPLDPETAFTSLSIFQLLKFPLDALPDLLINILSSLVSVRRIDKFLQEDETEKYEQLLRTDEDGDLEEDVAGDRPVVGFQDASFTFTSEEALDSNSFILKDLNLSFPTEALSIIAGPVGSGKTALLLSLLGETRQISGNTFFPCPISRALVDKDPETGLAETVAYCSQSAWLLGTTIKENILFGSEYDEKRYKACIKACALEPDLKILEFGDQTQVGEKGTALSGGQKARVALCRALFSSSKFLLIDDALSAVDAHTAEHLYSQYLTGPLAKGRTIILVTHAVSLCLPGSSFVVAMNEGKVVSSGSPEKVLASGVFADETPSGSSSEGSDHQAEKGKEAEPKIEELAEGGQTEEERAQLEKKQEKAKAEEEETYAKGSVGFETYALYFKSLSPNPFVIFMFWLTLVALFITSRGTDVSSAAWLRKWAGSYDRREESVRASSRQTSLVLNSLVSHIKIPNFLSNLPDSISSSFNSSLSIVDDTILPHLQFQVQQSHQPIVHQGLIGATSTPPPYDPEVETTKYLTVYALLALTYVLLTILRDATTFWGSLRSSKALYKKLISSLLKAPPRFYDQTPLGRIMNRLSKDVETIDQELSPVLLFLLDILLQTVSILAVVIYAVPEFAWLAVLIMIIFAGIGAIYLTSSRDLKRIESVQRSPIYTLIGEVLNGSVAIRAFGDSGRFTRHCLRLIDKASSPFFFLWYENRWLSIRTDLIASVVAACAALLLIFNEDADASLSGFTLSYSIMLLETILWIVRLYTQVEISMNSVERIDEYLGKIEPERQGGVEPPAYWPSRSGNVEVKNLSVRYAKDFPLVLDQVSFEVKSGEKVGICGRTGSGKSTLALAFFRFLEAESGSITIDGIDISQIPLSTLRSKLTVIPQEAQLFSGSIRDNLDPFNEHEDGTLWFALERCRLTNRGSTLNTPAVSRPGSPGPQEEEGEELERNTINSLDMKVENGGKNFSSGQRQLLSLTRGLLRMQSNNILLLDEATSNMDSATDALIQKAVREELGKESILFVIAHRLRTIADFDKIVVLDKGKLLEFDSPANLLRDPNSSFYDLAKKSGDFNLLMEMALKHENTAEQATV